MKNKSLKSKSTEILVTAILAIVKVLGGYFGNSYVLMAYGVESTAGIFTSGTLRPGINGTARPAKRAQQFSQQKRKALIAVGISLLVTTAAVILAIAGVKNIFTPHDAPKAYTLIILIAVIAGKGMIYRNAQQPGLEIDRARVKADAFHHASDGITSSAAFLGTSIGLIGGEGYEVADDWAALFAAVIIIFNAYNIAKPAIGELLDEGLKPELELKVKQMACEVNGVIQVEKCQVRKIGALNHAHLHIWVDKDLSAEREHIIAHMLKHHLRSQLQQFDEVMVHIEPDKKSALSN